MYKSLGQKEIVNKLHQSCPCPYKKEHRDYNNVTDMIIITRQACEQQNQSSVCVGMVRGIGALPRWLCCIYVVAWPHKRLQITKTGVRRGIMNS